MKNKTTEKKGVSTAAKVLAATLAALMIFSVVAVLISAFLG